jgi:hypothetical protein
MKMIVLSDRKTKERVYLKSKHDLLLKCYDDYREKYTPICEYYVRLLEKYKNVPLQKYKLTSYDRKKIAENPSYADDLPEYYIPGFDSKMGTSFEKIQQEEFLRRFKEADKKIVQFINSTNKNFAAEVVELY